MNKRKRREGKKCRTMCNFYLLYFFVNNSAYQRKLGLGSYNLQENVHIYLEISPFADANFCRRISTFFFTLIKATKTKRKNCQPFHSFFSLDLPGISFSTLSPPTTALLDGLTEARSLFHRKSETANKTQGQIQRF